MSTTFNLNADGYTKQALQICGLLTLGRQPAPGILADARDLFSTILKTLQTRGVTLTQAVRRTQTLTVGIDSYTLASDVIDIDEVSTVKASGETEETWVERMTYSDYQTISNKTTQGIPTRVYPERTSSVTVKFWSVPEKTYTWNYRAIVLLPDADAGSTTPGLTQRWMGALVWRLAYWLSHANNLNPEKRRELEAQADLLEAQVMGQENERGSLCMSLPPDPYGSY